MSELRDLYAAALGTIVIAAMRATADYYNKLGFAIAGISFAIGLAALTFFLVVIQLGPLLVWLPVAIWLGTTGQTGWAGDAWAPL